MYVYVCLCVCMYIANFDGCLYVMWIHSLQVCVSVNVCICVCACVYVCECMCECLFVCTSLNLIWDGYD